LIANRETGRSWDFGFIEMNPREAANAAEEKFNGHNLHGKTLKVDEALERIEKVAMTAHGVSFIASE
jgi:RNA recognition motif-containing protein